MFAFQICVAGIIATGGALVIQTSYRDAVVYGVIGCLCLSYFFFFCIRKKDLPLNSAEKCLLCFVAIGLLYVLLSFFGVNQQFQNLDLYFDKGFIPRQAVYFLFFPAIILFQDDFYTKGKDYLLSHYGEFLFWALFLYEFFTNVKTVQLVTNFLLGWLALRIKSPQVWRRWLMYAAVLLAPMPRDGTSTMLVLRMIFLATVLIPRVSNRILLRWMTIGVLLVIIVVSIVAPMVLSDTSFISDFNTRWRLDYWQDEMNNLEKTYGLGVGYGTSYPSKTFGKTNLKLKAEEMFVVACHNSFVAVAMRTGVFGIGALLLFLFLMLWEMTKYSILAHKSAFFALMGAAVVIAFNVGLESPSYLFCFIFCLGECNQEVWRIRRESRRLAASTGGT